MSTPDCSPMLALLGHLAQRCRDAGIDPGATTLGDWMMLGVLVTVDDGGECVRIRFVPEAVGPALAQLRRVSVRPQQVN